MWFLGVGIGRKYLPIWVSVLVLELNQNSGFGRTLDRRSMNGLGFVYISAKIGRGGGQYSLPAHLVPLARESTNAAYFTV